MARQRRFSKNAAGKLPGWRRLLIWHVLAEREPLSANELARATWLSVAAIHQTLQGALTAGWLRRAEKTYDYAGTGRLAYGYVRVLDWAPRPKKGRRHDHRVVHTQHAGERETWVPTECRFLGRPETLRDVFRKHDAHPLFREYAVDWHTGNPYARKRRHAYFPIDELSDPSEETR